MCKDYLDSPLVKRAPTHNGVDPARTVPSRICRCDFEACVMLVSGCPAGPASVGSACRKEIIHVPPMRELELVGSEVHMPSW